MTEENIENIANKHCSIGFCPHIDTKQSQHSACYMQNGVYCTKYSVIRGKGLPCLDENEKFDK